MNSNEKNPYALIDLHMHLDGSLSVPVVRTLAEMQHMPLPEGSQLIDQLQVSPNCRSLNEYLQKFELTAALLMNEDALRTAAYLLAEELQQQGLLYAEIRFAPQRHTAGGLTQRQIVAAVIDGLKRSSFHSGLILCCMRGEGTMEANFETVRTAAAYLGRGVVAVDLAGAEVGYPCELYRELFALAAREQIPITIHAGEACGPENVRAALQLGAARIGHGVRSPEDPETVRELVQRGTVLELCPTSNLNTCIFEDIRDYPILKLMENGVKVTVNTDNMTVSNVTLDSEFRLLMNTFSFTEEQLRTIVYNAADACFADETTKQWLKEQLRARFHEQG